MTSDIWTDGSPPGWKDVLKIAEGALIAVQTMRNTREPRKLDEALSWRENDLLAERKYNAALAAIQAAKEGACIMPGGDFMDLLHQKIDSLEAELAELRKQNAILTRDLDHERREKYTAQGIAAQERLKRADISQVSAAQE